MPDVIKQQNALPQTADRSQYARIPRFAMANYRSDGWGFVQNPLTFVNNVGAHFFNSVIDLVNGPIVATQIMTNEGAGAFWDNEVEGMRAMWDGISRGVPNYFKGIYDYHFKTPAVTQWEHFKRDMTDIEQWEQNTALGLTIFSGGYGVASRAGLVGRGSGMLTRIPSGVSIPRLPSLSITTPDGFLFRGFNINSPFNIPVQRFGRIGGVNDWGLRLGPNKFVNRTFHAIDAKWGNPLTHYNLGTIPKGAPMKFGLIGPQGWRYPGGSFQFRIDSRYVINQSTQIIKR